jgi:hypothetical protein
VIAATLGSTRASAAPNPSPPPSAITQAEIDDTSWRQVFMAPRITGNLRAVAVDPSDGKSIYVGLEEGTLAHTSDGGITWDEVPISPFLMQSPALEPSLYGPIPKVVDVFAGFHWRFGEYLWNFDPLGRQSAEQSIPLAPPFFGKIIAPQWVTPFGFPPLKEAFLQYIGARSPKPYEEHRRLKVCPGGLNWLLVTTKTKLMGSSDGTNFTQLFDARETAPIVQVACNPTNPNDIVLITEDGTSRSLDGGLTFDPLAGALGAMGATAVNYGPAEGGKSKLYVATGRDLWIGDPDEPDGMKSAPLNGENNADIRHINASRKAIWLATDNSVKVSRDAGATWSNVDDLEGFAWEMIAVLPGEGGAPDKIAALAAEFAFLSSDGGASFQLFFRGQSRRSLRQIVTVPASPPVPAGFLLVTSGELWTTTPPDSTVNTGDTEHRRWAELRLKKMPPIDGVIHRALLRARLLDVHINALYSGLKKRAWLPGVQLVGRVEQNYLGKAEQATITAPQGKLTFEKTNYWTASVNLVWELPDLAAPKYDFSPVRADLYELQKRFGYVVEDAYNERRAVLEQIAAGGLTPEQLLTLQSRVEVLDVALDEFTGESSKK